jgi:hypothetical protein
MNTVDMSAQIDKDIEECRLNTFETLTSVVLSSGVVEKNSLRDCGYCNTEG